MTILLMLAVAICGVLILAIVVIVRPVAVPPFPAIRALPFPDGAPDPQAGDPRLNPVCTELFLSHGTKTPAAFILMHGLSNCPAQFRDLARLLHARGHNVFVPRLPFHGEADILTADYGNLTLPMLADWTARVLGIGEGIGEEVIVVGLSVNGVTAAWIAENCSGVERCVLLSPFLAPPGIPSYLRAPLANGLARLPNIFVWWNPELKMDNPGPPYAYPRFPTRVVGKFMVLADHVLYRSAEAAPACKEITLVTSEADAAIDLGLSDELAARFAKWPGVTVRQVRFPQEEMVQHDFVDPHQPGAQTRRLNPILVRILEGEPD